MFFTFIRGIRNSHIFFNSTLGHWQLQSLRYPEKSLLMPETNSLVLPIGTNEWELTEDDAICGMEATEIKQLSFSTCHPWMYTCNTGHCIDLSQRCDTEIDCPDKSDEYNCNYLVFGPNYAKELIPRDREGNPVVVYLNVSILAIPEIDTVNLKFTVDFYLNLRWYDLRLGIQDLNNITLLNTLGEEELDSIWKPQLAFTNALGPFQTEADELTTATIVREDDSLPEDPYLSTEGTRAKNIVLEK